jgi:hypothetical protein
MPRRTVVNYPYEVLTCRAISKPKGFRRRCTGVIGPSHFAGAVGMRSRASRRRLSDNDIWCSATDRRWFPARPAQHVHRRRNNEKSRIPSALGSAHGRNGKRRVETCSALQRRTRRSASRSASLPCHTLRKCVENVPRRIAQTTHFERNDVTIICETVHQGFFAEMLSIRPRSGSNPRPFCPNSRLFWTAVGEINKPAKHLDTIHR